MEQVAVQYARGPLMLAANRDIITKPIFRKAKHSPAPLEPSLNRKQCSYRETQHHSCYRRYRRYRRHHQNSQEDHQLLQTEAATQSTWGTTPNRAISVLHGGTWTGLHNLVLGLDERSR